MLRKMRVFDWIKNNLSNLLWICSGFGILWLVVREIIKDKTDQILPYKPDGYTPKELAEVLYNAMKGWGTNEDAIASVRDMIGTNYALYGQISAAFGKREYAIWGAAPIELGSNHTLEFWLRHELTDKELAPWLLIFAGYDNLQGKGGASTKID